MASSGSEVPREVIAVPTGVSEQINAPGFVTEEEIGEAGSQEVIEASEAGEGEPLLVDGERERQRVAEKRVKDDAVFKATELKLKDYDERERLLAETYRDSEKQRKEVAEAQRKLAGNSTYKLVGSDLDTNDDDSCYIEIKNLVLIEESLIHKKALEEWDRKEKLFSSRVERKTNKVENLKNEVYQLIGFFSVFQGVVLTAVSQSNLLHCNNLWSPIVLSVLASFVTTTGVGQKLKQISALKKTIYSENLALKDVVHRGQELRREAKDFVFAKFSENKKKGFNKEHFWWYASGVLGFLVVFSATFPLSHWRILCHPGHDPYGAPPPT